MKECSLNVTERGGDGSLNRPQYTQYMAAFLICHVLLQGVCTLSRWVEKYVSAMSSRSGNSKTIALDVVMDEEWTSFGIKLPAKLERDLPA